MKNYSQDRPIYFSLTVLRSEAYSVLSAAQIKVLNEFYIKRQVKKIRGQAGRKDRYVILNDGEIVFSGRTGAKKMGLNISTFKRAIRQLILVGFIDVSHVGGGLQGDCHKYAFSDRWELYGTDKFVYKEPPTGSHGTGFTHENWAERTKKQRRKQK
jgi:hypothetical protein